MSSPSSNTSTNKRKADALGCSRPTDGDGGGRPAVIARLKDATSVSDPSSPTTPHIPPPIWGRVLDFMPYEEVRSALLVGQIIANEAVKYVRTLNFMKSCQLDGPSTRRFQNAEEVNCLCLFSGQWGSAILCSDTTIRLVPLLMTFSKVKRIYVGGLITQPMVPNDQWHLVRCFYHSSICSSPIDHRDLAKTLWQNLLGAFKARLLPLDFDIKGGIVSNYVGELRLCARRNIYADYTNSEGMCAICRDVCSFFPLNEIVDNPHFCGCVAGYIEVFEAISKRKGAKDAFRKDSDFLPNFVDGSFQRFAVKKDKSNEEEALWRRLTDFGMCGDKDICYLTMAGINDLDRMLAFGYNPRAVSKKRLYGDLNIGQVNREFDVYAKSTFDALVTRGFAFDEADLFVLDERMEPALKGLPALIRGESYDNT